MFLRWQYDDIICYLSWSGTVLTLRHRSPPCTSRMRQWKNSKISFWKHTETLEALSLSCHRRLEFLYEVVTIRSCSWDAGGTNLQALQCTRISPRVRKILPWRRRRDSMSTKLASRFCCTYLLLLHVRQWYKNWRNLMKDYFHKRLYIFLFNSLTCFSSHKDAI